MTRIKSVIILLAVLLLAITPWAPSYAQDGDSISYLKKAKYKVYKPFTQTVMNNTYETDFNSITQTENGFIQFGTQLLGFLNYNGTSCFRAADLDDITPVECVSSYGGKVYIGGDNAFGYVLAENLGQILSSLGQFVDLTTPVLGNEDIGTIRQILHTKSGVYFVGEQRIFHYDMGNSVKTINRHGYLAYLNKEVYIWENGIGFNKLESRTNAYTGPKNLEVVAIEVVADKAYLITRNQGIYVYEKGECASLQSSINTYLLNQEVTASAKLNDNSLALAMSRGEIIVVETNGNCLTIINEQDGLSEARINDLFVDQNGYLWVAMDGGVNVVDYPGPISYVDGDFGFFGVPKTISSFANEVYVGTTEGLFIRPLITSKNYNPRFRRASEIKGACWSMCPVNQSLLIAGEEGLFEKSTKGIQQLSQVPATAVLQSSLNADVVFCAQKDGLWELRLRPNGWEYYRMLSSEVTGVTNMAEDVDGSLWIGSVKGGWIVDALKNRKPPKHLYPMTSYEGPNAKHYTGSVNALIVEDEPFFQSGGLWFYDTLFVPLSQNGDDHATKFAKRARPFTHFSNSGEFYISSWGKFERNFEDSVYGTLINKDGLSLLPKSGDVGWSTELRRDGGFDIAYYASDGVLYYGINNEKLFTYDGRCAKAPYPVLKTHIYQLTVSHLQEENAEKPNSESFLQDINAKPSLPKKIPYGYNSLSFFYSGVGKPPDVRWSYLYSFSKKGEPTRWSANPTRNNNVIFENVREGDYVFRVKAFYSYGSINIVAQEDSHEFSILPPWYRSWGAYLLYAILLVIVFGFLIKLNSSRLLRQKALLKKIVQNRTAEIQEQKRQIEVLMLDTVHRTKGHIQLTKNLLEMQARRMQNLGAQSALNDAKGRLELLEKLQKQMLQTPQGELISSTAFFTDIANGLRQAYGFSDQGFQMKLQIDERPLPPDEATYLGLLASEIMMNAFKYAFKDHPSPCLKLAYKTDEGGWSLKISDNGPGIDQVNKGDSYGQELIGLFAEQLEAALRVYNDDGAVFELVSKQSAI